jgi:acetyl esterase
MPLRTRLLTTFLDHGPRDVTKLTPEEIPAARAWVAPARAPFTWVTGAVPPQVRIHEVSFPCRDGSPRQIRAYHPPTPGPHPVVVFFHGGGWVMGNTRMYDPLCADLAASIPALVLSVDYRLAPEWRAPQAVLDCIDATRWVAGHAGDLGGDPTRLAVCGDSAGGNLAALVCHTAHDDGGPGIAHQALIYPGTDLSKSFPSIREHANAPVLTEQMMDVFLAHYLGPDPAIADLRDPRLSPYWREDLRGLPPALVQTAELDPLRDEGQAYAARLAEAGVQVRATNYLGTVHGFASFPGATVIGRQARLELVTELRSHLAPAASPSVD